MKPLLSMPPIMVLCACLLACGDSTHGDTGSSSTATKKTSTSGSIDNHIYGDYDHDDLAGDQNTYDGDNDDPTRRQDRDGDFDNSSGSYYDNDDSIIRDFGHEASPADRRAISTVVMRYYTAAAAADGAAMCSTIESSIANAIPEDLGGAGGPPYARGNTCAVVMSKIDRANHRQLAAYAAKVRVASVRLDHNSGLAVLSFKTLPAREIAVIREGKTWKLDGVLDSELP